MKSSKVKFITEKLEQEFENLDESDFLKKSIKRALEDLKTNAFSGIQIPKSYFLRNILKNIL